MASFINVHDWLYLWSVINKLAMGCDRRYAFELSKKNVSKLFQNPKINIKHTVYTD